MYKHQPQQKLAARVRKRGPLRQRSPQQYAAKLSHEHGQAIAIPRHDGVEDCHQEEKIEKHSIDTSRSPWETVVSVAAGPGVKKKILRHWTGKAVYVRVAVLRVRQIVKSAIDVSRHEGKLYAAPFVGNIAMFAYRKDLLAKHGFDRPKSWSEVAKAAQTIQDKEQGSGYVDDGR